MQQSTGILTLHVNDPWLPPPPPLPLLYIVISARFSFRTIARIELLTHAAARFGLILQGDKIVEGRLAKGSTLLIRPG